MATKAHYSLQSFNMGAVGDDGGMGTDLTVFDDPVRNTTVLTQADGTDTDFDGEISDYPFYTITEPGDTTLTADFYAKSAAQLQKVFGGTVTAASGTNPESWNAPSSSISLYRSIELVQKDGSKIQLPYVAVTATLEWNFKRNALPLIHLKGKVLQPIDPTSGAPLTTIGPVNFVGATA